MKKIFLFLINLSVLILGRNINYALPFRSWGTYFCPIVQYGVEGVGNQMAMDSKGNVYWVGCTASPGLATLNAYDTILNDVDGFIAKFSPNGARLWVTYYGGESWDSLSGVAVDNQDNIYVCGATASQTGVATPGAYKTVLNGGKQGFFLNDHFLAKFNAQGQRLWATYCGGNDDEGQEPALAVDSQRNVFLTGVTKSPDIIPSGLPVTIHDASYNGMEDVYLVKFDGNGTFKWVTYYGGVDVDGDDLNSYFFLERQPCIGLMAHENTGTNVGVVIGGKTFSSSGITKGIVHDSTYNGSGDAFLACFDPNAGSLKWGTYYGGINGDWATALAIDGKNNIYLAGTTYSLSGIAKGNVHQPVLRGGNDAFLAKFSKNGALNWATYYGGQGINDNQTYEGSFGVAVNTNGTEVYLAGYTECVNFISTAQSYDVQAGFADVLNGYGSDAYITKLNAGTGERLWGTYYGGTQRDTIYSIILDPKTTGVFYVNGMTQSPDSIASQGAYDSIIAPSGNSNWDDFFLARFFQSIVVIPVP